MAKPAFNPSQPFEPAAGAEPSKPKFNPTAAFEPAEDKPQIGSVPAFPGSPEDEAQKASSQPLSAAPQEGTLDRISRVVKSTVGPAIAGVVGLGENAVSGTTGVLAAGANLANAVTGATRFLKRPNETDAEYYRRNREEHTFAPRSPAGKEIAASPIPQEVGKFVEQGGEQFAHATGSPAAGELFKDTFTAGTAGAPMLEGGLAVKSSMTPKGMPKAAVPKGPVKTKISETPTDSLTTAGYDFGPRDKAALDPSKKLPFKDKLKSAAEGLAGRNEISDARTVKNQANSTRLITKGLGLSDRATAITPKMLETQAKPHIEKYGEVGKAVGEFAPSENYGAALDQVANKNGIDPDVRPIIDKIVDQYRYAKMSGPDAVKTVSALRRRAAKERQSQDVNVQDRGDAKQAVADAIEDEIGRTLEATGNAQLLGEWQSARTALAKIHEAETATVAGQVDAHVLKRLRDRGAPLSGEAAIVADAAEYLQQGTRHSQKVVKAGDFNVPKPTMAGAAQAAIRPLLQKHLVKDVPRPELGPNAGLADYFPQPKQPPLPEPPPGSLPPTPSSSMHVANKMAGDLDLVPDQFPNAVEAAPTRARPTDLTAEMIPEQRGDINFTSSQPQGVDLAAELGLAPETAAEGLRFTPSNQRAPSMAGDLGFAEDARVSAGPDNRVGGTRFADDSLVDLDAESPQGPFAHGRGNSVDFKDPGALGQYFAPDQMREAGQYRTGDLSLADDFQLADDLPPSAPNSPQTPINGPKGPQVDLADDFAPSSQDLADQAGIKIVPNAKRPGFFDVRGPGQASGVAVKGMEAAKSLADDLVGDLLSDEAASSQPKGQKVEYPVPSKRFGGQGEAERLPGIEVQETQAPRPPRPAKGEEMTVESDNGALILRPVGNSMRVRYAKTKNPGKGEGMKLYTQAIKDVEAQGKDFMSDSIVSEAAARVYDKLEKDPRYEVIRNEAEFDPKAKVWTSKVSSKPVFEVRTRKQKAG